MKKYVSAIIKTATMKRLEWVLVCLLIFKLAFAVFPLFSKGKTVSGLAGSLGVNSALAKQPQGSNTKSPVTRKSKIAPVEPVQEATNKVVPLHTEEYQEVDPHKMRDDLLRKEALLDEREERLVQLKKAVQQDMDKLLVLQKDIKAHLQTKLDERQDHSKYLAKMYSSMKPKNAAKLLSELDETLAVNVLILMKPAIAGKILSYLEVKKAARLAKQFYYR